MQRKWLCGSSCDEPTRSHRADRSPPAFKSPLQYSACVLSVASSHIPQWCAARDPIVRRSTGCGSADEKQLLLACAEELPFVEPPLTNSFGSNLE